MAGARGLLIITTLASGQLIRAAEDPFSGYTGYTQSYLLEYAGGTSFAPGASGDVKVYVGINNRSHLLNLDTGSRGLYLSSHMLGPGFDAYAPGSYDGEVQLTSSGRVNSGRWVPTTVSFVVKDLANANATVTVNSTVNVLDVTELSAQLHKTAKFGVDTSVSGYDGKVHLVGGGDVDVQHDATTGEHYIELRHDDSVDQRVRYSENIAGLLHDVSNFGVGFDLGSPGGTGPVANNKNQIYNALINLDAMRDNSLVSGYIIQSNGVQLGLTSQDANYAYTTLNPTGLTSDNSVPDWQTPMGQTIVNGVSNGPGSIVMDSGIGDAYISPHDGGPVTELSVSLMNSGGLVGYHIDLQDGDNLLNPTTIGHADPGTDGRFSQNQDPYRTSFFNTGRNVFKAFDMLYDAENGYMGLLPNSYGAVDPNVFFTAQAGGFPNPIPEASPLAMVLAGIAFLSAIQWHRSKRKGGLNGIQFNPKGGYIP